MSTESGYWLFVSAGSNRAHLNHELQVGNPRVSEETTHSDHPGF